jgi:hypothetical protein
MSPHREDTDLDRHRSSARTRLQVGCFRCTLGWAEACVPRLPVLTPKFGLLKAPDRTYSSIGRPYVAASWMGAGALERYAASGCAPSASLIVETAIRSATQAVIAKTCASLNSAFRISRATSAVV